MTGKYTLTLIKPHAIADNNTGAILSMFNKAGFRISAIRMIMLSEQQTGEFYKEHKGKVFYDQLVQMMSSGPLIAAVLEKENAVSDLRNLIGNTDPGKADEGTVRKLFGRSMRENAVHASDSDENALRECSFFFSDIERF
jgi:nucleoside-diphosphate kinase